MLSCITQIKLHTTTAGKWNVHWGEEVFRTHICRHGYVKTAAYSYYFDLVLPFFDTMNKMGVATNYSKVRLIAD
jgi:hypothetical protein